jgi:hypothetical protein
MAASCSLSIAMCGDKTKESPVIRSKLAASCLAQPHCPLKYRLEHRLEVTLREIDASQHLGGRGLLFKCFTRLGHEPRVLHRDDRLRPEVLE